MKIGQALYGAGEERAVTKAQVESTRLSRSSFLRDIGPALGAHAVLRTGC